MCLLISESCAPVKFPIGTCHKFLIFLVIALPVTPLRSSIENSVNYSWKALWIIQHLEMLLNLISISIFNILGANSFSNCISVSSFIEMNPGCKESSWKNCIPQTSSYIWIPMYCEETGYRLVWWRQWNRSHYAIQLLPEHCCLRSLKYLISLSLQKWGCTKALHITQVTFLTELLNFELLLKSAWCSSIPLLDLVWDIPSSEN